MDKNKTAYLGAWLVGALLLALLAGPSVARLINALYGNRLWVEAEPRSGSPDVTWSDDAAYIRGTLEVDGASRFDGAIAAGADYTATAATVKISTSSSAGVTMRLRGAFTSSQIQFLTPALGDLVINTTANTLCVSSGTGVGGYVLLISTGGLSGHTRVACY